MFIYTCKGYIFFVFYDFLTKCQVLVVKSNVSVHADMFRLTHQLLPIIYSTVSGKRKSNKTRFIVGIKMQQNYYTFFITMTYFLKTIAVSFNNQDN